MNKQQILKDLGFHDINQSWGLWSFKMAGDYYTLHDIILSNLITNIKHKESLKDEIIKRMESL